MAGEQGYGSTRRERWEYLRTQVDANNIKSSDEAITRIGQDGWELVDVVYTQTYVHFWFKRVAR